MVQVPQIQIPDFVGSLMRGEQMQQSRLQAMAQRQALEDAARFDSTLAEIAPALATGEGPQYESAVGRLMGTGRRGFEMGLPLAAQARTRREAASFDWGGGAPAGGGQAGDPLTRIAAVESGGNDAARNPGSSAAGRFQIIDSTWNQYAPRLGLTPAQRMDPAAQEQVARAIQNDAQRAVGRPLRPAEAYGAHFLGIGGLRAFLSADPNADAQTVYAQAAGPQIAAQAFQRNPGLLAPGMTVGQVMQALERRMGGGQGGDTVPAQNAAPGGGGTDMQAELARIERAMQSGNPVLMQQAQRRLEVLRARASLMRQEAPAPTLQLGAGPHGPEGVYERTPQGLRYIGPRPEQTPQTVGTIPPGFQLQRGQDGSFQMVPIPGGPADLAERRTQRAEANQQTGRERTGNVVLQDLDRTLSLLDTSTLPVAGFSARTLSRIPGTAAADAARLLDGVRANVGFQQLGQMRSESPTGAALGAITERELGFLQSVLGSLDQEQSPRQFRDNLIRLRNVYLDIVHGPGQGPPRVQPGFQRGAAQPAGSRAPDATAAEITGPGGQGVASPPAVTMRRYNPATGRIE
jgi:hypothetical protein